MHSSSVVSSRLLAPGGVALLAVCLLLTACQRASEPGPPAPSVSSVSAPFDVMGVVRQVGRSFKSEGARFAGAQATYSVEVVGGALTFTPGHPELRRSVGLSLETVSLGRGVRAPLPAARVEVLEDGGLVLHRGGVRESLRNTEAGVEQSWEFVRKPEGEGALTVRMRTGGQRFVRASEVGLHFAPEAGGPGSRYGLATWVDARGVRTPLPAPRFERGEVVLEVPATLLESSAYPAVLDPLVSPESEVGEPLPGPTTGTQMAPRVAFDGTNYLVVWQSSSNPTGSSNWGIRATRVSRTGEVLDMGGFVVSSDASGVEPDEQEPSVAFNGTDYLVAWTTGFQIRVARVSTSGAVLDPAGVTVAHAVGKRGAPTVASDGQGFLVVWRDDELTGPSSAGIHSARVSGAGTVLDSSPRTLTIDAISQARPALVFIQGRYLVVWETSVFSATSNVVGRTLSTQNTVLGSFTVTSAEGHQRRPALASYGTGVLVVWEDLRGARQVYGVRLAPDGSRLDAADLPLGGGSMSYPLWLAAAFDGANVQVAWTEDRSIIESTQVKGVRVTPEGTRLGAASGVVLGSSTQLVGPPAMASDGAQVLLSWAVRVYGLADVCGTRVGRDGAAQDVPARILSSSFNVEEQPSVAFNGELYLVVWQDVRGGERNIYGARVERSGRVLDPTGLPIMRNVGGQSAPAVAASATEFFVVWEDFRERNNGSDIFGARVRWDGTVVDSTGLLLGTSITDYEMDPRVASDGSGFVVVWTRSSSFGNSVRGVFMRSGVVGAPIVFASPAAIPDVAFLGTQYLVTWLAGGNPTGARVTTGGEVVDVGGRVLVVGSSGTRNLTLAGSGQGGGLLVWQERTAQTLNATRVTAEGTVLDPGGFLVSSGVPPLLVGARDLGVVFEGMNYLVAWRATSGGVSTVYGHRVSLGGEVLEGERFLIADEPGIQYGLSLASDGEGQVLVAYSRAGVPPLTAQVKMRFVHSLPLGSACSAGGDCASGFCVDGVCCDNACGGGAATDCQACAVASGGAVDGTCGAVIAAEWMCRASAGVCDVAEVCDGVDVACPTDGFVAAGVECRPAARACDAVEVCGGDSAECPEDVLEVDGTSCDDASACTREDTCQSGVCMGSDPVVCTVDDVCQVPGTCDAATGTCSAPMNMPDGTACDDGNACTRVDACLGGRCMGVEPLVCSAPNPCMKPGTCDAATGQCSPPTPVADGTACDDGNACTRIDSCQAGTCLGAQPVVCGASDSCHEAGVCDPLTGSCSNPEREDGAECVGGSCQSGVCIPAPDAGSEDAGVPDAGGDADAGTPDASSEPDAGGDADAGTPDASSEPDAGVEDAGIELDAGAPDAGAEDAGSTDAGREPDAGTAEDSGSASDAGGSGGPSIPAPEEPLGCGCGSSSDSSSLGLLMLLAGALLLRASRRRHV